MIVSYVKLDARAKVPARAHPSDAGNDLCAFEEVVLGAGQRALVKTGLAVAIPEGYYGRIAPRSGLAVKWGADVLAGVVDASYRGELGVVLINLDKARTLFVEAGDKIAQLIITPCAAPEWREVAALEDTSRGAGGYGSSDAKPPEFPPIREGVGPFGLS